MHKTPTPDSPSHQLAHNPNRNGWTDEKKAAFITALAATPSVTAAAAAVGMTPQSAYWLKRHAAAGSFSDDWDAAVARAWQQVEANALDRLLNGEIETLFRDGTQIIRHRPCAPALVIHMLDRAVAVREKAEAIAASLPAIAPDRSREIQALTHGESRESENPENIND